MNHRKLERTIGRLCGLGLDSRLVMPRILGLLHDYIPSFANVYFWIEEDGQIRDIYDEYPQAYAALPVYHEKFLGRSELEVWDGLSETAKIKTAVHMDQLWRIPREDVLKHEFYREFLGKVGNHWGLQKSIWVNGKPRGLLHLKRKSGEKNFCSSDIKRLEEISKHIAYAIENQSNNPEPISSHAVESAKLIVDYAGHIHHYTSKAERIMMLSQGEAQISAQFDFSHSRLPSRLVALVNPRKNGQHSARTSNVVQNRWGRFKYSSFPLSENSNNSLEQLTILQIDHYIPIRLFLFNQLERLDLTDRQFQICFAILEGKSYALIAQEFDLQESTVVSHKKEIFQKANVADRHELSDKIYHGG